MQLIRGESLLCVVCLSALLIIPLRARPAPGAVGHLSFTEILDTSLKVSWSEPGEKNGVLTGTFTFSSTSEAEKANKYGILSKLVCVTGKKNNFLKKKQQ